MIQQYGAFVREYFFPRGCAVCNAILLEPIEAWRGICAQCVEGFDLHNRNRCTHCGRELISEQSCCVQCRTGNEQIFDQLMLIYPYKGIYQRALSRYKFERSTAVGNFLSEILREAAALLRCSNPVWVPVPPRPGKIKESGWDQIEYLATRLERKKDVPVCRCLKRLQSQSQKTLNYHKRMLNIKGNIQCVRPAPAEALLFDDVFTTGSTLAASAEALRDRGAKKVYGLCLCYTS
ncbi:hypothetical protein PilKf_00299 [Pillotina sp. SPG140]|jgi:ComF family protein